jgi:hypothetical protein
LQAEPPPDGTPHQYLTLSWRTFAPLLVILLIELVVSIALAVNGTAPSPATLLPSVALFGVAAPLTALAYWLLASLWRRTAIGWKRFGLCLLTAFVTYQLVVALFFAVGLLFRPPPVGDVLGWILIGLIGANAIFFPIWVVLGVLAYILLRLFSGQRSGMASPAGKQQS